MVGRITGLQVAAALRYRYRDLRHCAGLGRLRGVGSCLGIYRRIWLMWFSHFAIVLPLPPRKPVGNPIPAERMAIPENCAMMYRC